MDKRENVRLPVQVKILEQSGFYNFSFAYGLNISQEGMALEPRIIFSAKKKAKPGSQLKLKFKLPGGDYFLDVLGEVVWVKDKEKQPCYGIRFIEPSDNFKADYSRFSEQFK